MRIRLAAAALAVAAVLAPVSALADSTPIGPLPKGPTTTITAKRGGLVAVALPKDPKLVWRFARPARGAGPVAKQVAETDAGPSVVVVYRIAQRGTVTIAYALTKGDTSSKAVKARYFKVRGT
jgi:hypothetical protein